MVVIKGDSVVKVINIMNFVRQCEPRWDYVNERLFSTTKAQLELLNKYGLDNTFLLQYDVLCDQKYVDLFKNNVTDRTELGLWFEIPEPLTTDCNLPYRSENGWKWDWHIIPGFSMGYTPEEREKLIDQAMKKFKDIFGYYPKTVGTWVIDTHTVNYLTNNYSIDAICICRDQVNTDAYSLRGGYFNQGYYPSKYNIFTPAQTDENRVNTPVFRLLGSCPIHSYDTSKYVTERIKELGGCYTMELVWEPGSNPDIVDWFYKTYFENESLNFAYMQIGQENSFADYDLITPFKMQLDKAIELPDVEFLKISETGKRFKQLFPNKTPATAVTALEDWDDNDIQSVYYDSQNYTANIFRYNKQLFIRALYLFDERVEDKYLNSVCDTFDAVFENLPVVDTLNNEAKENIGLLIDDNIENFTVYAEGKDAISINFDNRRIVFCEDRIDLFGDFNLKFFIEKSPNISEYSETYIVFDYNGNKYSLIVENGMISKNITYYDIIGKDFTIKMVLQ